MINAPQSVRAVFEKIRRGSRNMVASRLFGAASDVFEEGLLLVCGVCQPAAINGISCGSPASLFVSVVAVARKQS